MTISFGSTHITTYATDESSPHSGSFDLDNSTTAIIIAVTTGDTVLITGVTFGGVSAIESVQYRNNGGLSIWRLNSPNTSGLQTLNISWASGTINHIRAAVFEVYGGDILVDDTDDNGDNSGEILSTTCNSSTTNGLMVATLYTAQGDPTKLSPTGVYKQDIGSDELADSAVTKIFAYVAEGALTFVQMFRVAYAVLAGKSSGGGTTTIIFRDVADAKDRVSATVDSDGNRTAMTNDGT